MVGSNKHRTSTKEIAVLVQCEKGKTVWLTNIVELSHINNISAVMYVRRYGCQ